MVSQAKSGGTIPILSPTLKGGGRVPTARPQPTDARGSVNVVMRGSANITLTLYRFVYH